MSGKPTTRTQKTDYRDYRNDNAIIKFILTGFGVSFVPLLICAAVTAMWFFFFWGPYASKFTNLFPVSQWLWLPLLLIITGIAPTLFHHRFITDHKREKYFIRFCNVASTLRGGSALAMQYVVSHRSSVDHEKDVLDMENAFKNITNNEKRVELREIWLQSISVEANAVPYSLALFSYICVWTFCLTVPFVYWSFYTKLGALGVLFVTWPILAVVYGPLDKKNQFEDPAVHWYVHTDYMKRAQALTTESTET
jgi:hypothetical protein